VTARNEILARVRTALGDRPAPPEVRRDYRTAERAPAMPAADLLDRLVDRLVDYRAQVRRSTAAEIPGAVAAALADRGARRLVVPAGVPPAWLATVGDGVELVRDDPPLPATALDRLDGVLTASAVAIAETGTIVLDAGPGQGRRALSLVPDYHLVVVTADQVVATVPEAVARLDPTRPLTWISGPSATSDIELTRVEGVHGPCTLEVVVCDR
jgi:L-lactate dehydrogenase complex protein LldG